ncbi:UNKNOWN [Stylonychia lemnae]|uniref:Uncharacterized protein n=1 Tax=Stylonychia lemnae TaxID=5949 RepID=A0A077ZZY6_STYLE|nr:UNKNOWN [Stylonychia lemnae]|eukprot:CDW75465.1 UNKNOWN [Stylonychia lemnae]
MYQILATLDSVNFQSLNINVMSNLTQIKEQNDKYTIPRHNSRQSSNNTPEDCSTQSKTNRLNSSFQTSHQNLELTIPYLILRNNFEEKKKVSNDQTIEDLLLDKVISKKYVCPISGQSLKIKISDVKIVANIINPRPIYRIIEKCTKIRNNSSVSIMDSNLFNVHMSHAKRDLMKKGTQRLILDPILDFALMFVMPRAVNLLLSLKVT